MQRAALVSELGIASSKTFDESDFHFICFSNQIWSDKENEAKDYFPRLTNKKLAWQTQETHFLDSFSKTHL